MSEDEAWTRSGLRRLETMETGKGEGRVGGSAVASDALGTDTVPTAEASRPGWGDGRSENDGLRRETKRECVRLQPC